MYRAYLFARHGIVLPRWFSCAGFLCMGVYIYVYVGLMCICVCVCAPPVCSRWGSLGFKWGVLRGIYIRRLIVTHEWLG